MATLSRRTSHRQDGLLQVSFTLQPPSDVDEDHGAPIDLVVVGMIKVEFTYVLDVVADGGESTTETPNGFVVESDLHAPKVGMVHDHVLRVGIL